MSMVTPVLRVELYSTHRREKKKAYPLCRICSPRDWTCLEDCPDVCVQNREKWVVFWSQGRE